MTNIDMDIRNKNDSTSLIFILLIQNLKDIFDFFILAVN